MTHMKAVGGLPHYMVLLGMDDQNVYVNDPEPANGKGISYPLAKFNLAWGPVFVKDPTTGKMKSVQGHNYAGVTIPRNMPTGATYTYTSNPFTQFEGTPGVTGANFVSATMTLLCALPPSSFTDVTDLALRSWSITDGIHSMSSSDADSELLLEGVTLSGLLTDSSGHLDFYDRDLWFMAVSGNGNWIYTRDGGAVECWDNCAWTPAVVPWSGPTGMNPCATQTYAKYSYLGNVMSDGLALHAFFVMASPLPPSQSGGHITPLAWGIDDGDVWGYVMNFGNGDKLLDLEVWTDSQGAIVGWNFSASGKQWPAMGGVLTTSKTPTFTADVSNVLGLCWPGVCAVSGPYSGQNANTPGTWTASPF